MDSNSNKSERMIQDDADDDGSGRQKESDSSSDHDQESGSGSESRAEESDASEADMLEQEVEANEQHDGSDESDEDEDYVSPAAEYLLEKLKHWPEDEDELAIVGDVMAYFMVNIDPFCTSLRGNAVIKKMFLAMDPRFLDSDLDLRGCFVKLGNVFGSLEALTELHLGGSGSVDFSLFTIAAEDILQRTRQIRSFRFTANNSINPGRNFDAYRFANALRHHPVQEIEMTYLMPGETCIIMNVLSTLPNLQRVTLGCHIHARITALHPQVLSQLLSIGTLREVLLEDFRFTELGLQAICGGLSSGSLVSKLLFVNCHFPETGGAALAACLGQNKALEQLRIHNLVPDSTFFSALKDSLPANRTLTELCVNSGSHLLSEMLDTCLVKALEGLGDSQSLQSLILGQCPLTIAVSDAWRECLEKNSELRNLLIGSSSDLNDESWLRILPFLRVNSRLESLRIAFQLTKAILPETAEALQENSSLQHLIFDSDGFSRADLIEFVGMLTKNTTLKHLQLGVADLDTCDWPFDEKEAVAALVAAVRGNYGLESLNATVSDPDDQRLLECIQRLNKAGRRYLLEDPTSIEKGVLVLDEVKDDLDCLFLHLQENPMLCDCGQVVVQQPVSGSRKRKVLESIEAAK